MENNFCRNCGDRLPEKSCFCSNCGSAVRVEFSAVTYPGAVPVQQVRTNDSCRRMQLDHDATVALMAAILAFMGVPVIASIAGLVLSGKVLSQDRTNSKARLARVLSVVGLVLFVILLAIVIPVIVSQINRSGRF